MSIYLWQPWTTSIPHTMPAVVSNRSQWSSVSLISCHVIAQEAWTEFFPGLPQLVECQGDTNQVGVESQWNACPMSTLSHTSSASEMCVLCCRYRGWLVRRVCCLLFVSGCKVYVSPVSNRLERLSQNNRYPRGKRRGVEMPDENK